MTELKTKSMWSFLLAALLFVPAPLVVQAEDAGIDVRPAHYDKISSICISPDGRSLASASNDGAIKIWDLTTNLEKVVCAGAGNGPAVYALAFSPDGKILAGGGTGTTGMIRIWNSENGVELRRLTESGCRALTFSPSGKSIICDNGIGTSVCEWDVGTGKLLRTIAKDAQALSLALSRDGKLLALGGNGVSLLNPVSGRKENDFVDGTHVYAVCFSPDGKKVASAGDDGLIRVREIRSSKGRTELGVVGIATADGSAGGKTITAVRKGSPAGHAGVRTSDRLISVNGTNVSKMTAREVTFRLCGLAGSKVSIVVERNGKKQPFTLIRAGCNSLSSREAQEAYKRLTVFIAACDPSFLQDISSGSRKLKGHKGAILSLAFSADGKIIASGGEDGTIRLWDASTGVGTKILNGHSLPVRAIASSPDGKLLASASRDKTIKLWNISSGKQFGELHAKKAKNP